MYVPEHYRERDPGVLFKTLRAHAFATIISSASDGRPRASWVPFLIEGEPERPVIFGHMARDNDHWRDWDAQTPLLAFFQGPHHYISPSWYPPGPAVPTWNYIAVSVHGRPRLLSDPVEVEAMLDRLVGQFEQGRAVPWQLGDQPADYRAGMARGIVAFELLINEIIGARKLSQARDDGDRAGAIEGLLACGGDDARAIAAAMAGTRRLGADG